MNFVRAVCFSPLKHDAHIAMDSCTFTFSTDPLYVFRVITDQNCASDAFPLYVFNVISNQSCVSYAFQKQLFKHTKRNQSLQPNRESVCLRTRKESLFYAISPPLQFFTLLTV
uniref:Uncharacterized protein n=1 Tax=Anguilla anguilla TaxID=7936 RepID=A0A0E9XJH6_ANGAN